MDLRILSGKEVARALSMGRTIELMREAYETLSAGGVEVPLRTALTNEAGTVLYKPAYSERAGIFCAKVVSVFPENAASGLEVCPGVLIVNAADTGMPIALIEAGYLTSLRTGAGTGVATDLFASTNARVAALFGTGGQARHQLEAMLAVRAFEIVYVFSRNPDHAMRFCEEHTGLAGECRLVPNPDRSVLRDCEVITTATTSPTPVFTADEVSLTVHINAIGSLGKERTELCADTVLGSRFVVDQRAACLVEAGEICVVREAGQLPDDFHPEEIGEVIARGSTPREFEDERTVFKSVGNAVQDLACVAEILKNKEGLQTISL